MMDDNDLYRAMHEFRSRPMSTSEMEMLTATLMQKKAYEEDQERERRIWPSGLSYGELRYRYQDDPHFASIVNQFVAFMKQNKVQPYEVKDAVFIAEQIYRERFVKPMAFQHRTTEPTPTEKE